MLRQNRGQLLLEYVLLIFVVATAAVMLSSALVSRDDADPGIIVYQWNRLLEMVGQDIGD